MKISIVFFLLLVNFHQSCGQITVIGSVRAEEDNSTLPGVSVVEKGTNNGTVSDANGTFSITVSNINAVLLFQFIGLRSKEVSLKEQKELVVTMKSECNKDFFDASQVALYVSSGVVNNPVGGQIDFSSPLIMRDGLIKATYGYQTNTDRNKLETAQVELAHFISNCDFDLDFRWSYRSALLSDLKSVANSIEADVNFSHGIKLIAGYSHVNFEKQETREVENSSGILIGIGKWINMPLHPIVLAKIAFYNTRIEYQASVQGEYRHFVCFVKYYKINSFNELSLGAGVRFGYRLRKPKR